MPREMPYRIQMRRRHLSPQHLTYIVCIRNHNQVNYATLRKKSPIYIFTPTKLHSIFKSNIKVRHLNDFCLTGIPKVVKSLDLWEQYVELTLFNDFCTTWTHFFFFLLRTLPPCTFKISNQALMDDWLVAYTTRSYYKRYKS